MPLNYLIVIFSGPCSSHHGGHPIVRLPPEQPTKSQTRGDNSGRRSKILVYSIVCSVSCVRGLALLSSSLSQTHSTRGSCLLELGLRLYHE